MRLLALVQAFWGDHLRSRGIIIESLAVLLYFAFFLHPDAAPFDSQYMALGLSWVALIISAITTGILVARNADAKIDTLVLGIGRPSFYIALFITALLVSIFWIALTSAFVFGLLPIKGGFPPGAVWNLFLTAGTNIVIVASLFLLFSPLAGRPVEPFYAIILVLITLGIQRSGGQFQTLERLAVLLPPISENIRAATGASNFPIIRNLLYVIGVLSLGLFRFIRREFLWQ